MITTTLRTTFLLVCGVLALPAAQAGDREFEAELDLHSAEVRPAGDGWRLRVEFKVELEDDYPRDRFDLLLNLTDGGALVASGDGQPWEYVLPLTVATEVDDDELEFKGVADVVLPGGLVGSPYHLCVKGAVLPAGSELRLAVDHADVRVCGVHVVYEPPVVVAPAPVIIEPAPVVVRPAPVIVRPAPVIVHRPVYVAPAPLVVHRPVYYGPVVRRYGYVRAW